MLLAEKLMVSEKEAKLYKYVSESGSLGCVYVLLNMCTEGSCL
jgi:hypothetical protein